jgi:hypothetical protein
MQLYTADGFTYFGMDESVVIALRAEMGRSTSFVTKEAYDAYVQQNQGN